MAKTLQFRRGTTAELSSVTGAEGELFVDTTKDTVVVMDGSTAGGVPLQKEICYTANTGSEVIIGNPQSIACTYLTLMGSSIISANSHSFNGVAFFNDEVKKVVGGDLYPLATEAFVAITGGYANSAYSQANTATTNAATADQRAVTSGSYANSAFSKANTAQIHAEAAFAAANTGGGGSSEITVNSDYSESINIANTYGVTSYTGTFTAGPDFGYIVGGLDAADASYNSMNPAASSINYNTSTKQLVLTGTDVNITNNINDWNTGYIQFSQSTTAYFGKITNTTVDGSTVTYTFENDSNLPQTDLNCNNYIFQSNYFRIFLDSVQPELDTLLSSQLKANATFTIDVDNGASTYTRTVSLYSRDGTNPSNIQYSLRVNTITNISFTTVASIQIDGLIPSAQSWTFDIDGSFNTSSALIGDLLMTDDIITPLAYDSYGVVDANTSGTLTINGNLEVSANCSLPIDFKSVTTPTLVPLTNGQYETITKTSSNTLVVNRKYILIPGNSDGQYIVFLPQLSAVSHGDVIEVVINSDNGKNINIAVQGTDGFSITQAAYTAGVTSTTTMGGNGTVVRFVGVTQKLSFIAQNNGQWAGGWIIAL